jgi:DNA gyrase subunit A
LSERQADAVLAMPLRRLTSLEQDGLRKESLELMEERERLRHLLDDRAALLESMVAELKALKKRYSTPRRTRLVAGGDDLVAQRAAAVRPNTELQRQQALEALPGDGRLLIQADGVVRIVTPQALGRLHLDEAAPLGEHPSPARLILPVTMKPSLLAFSASGRVAMLRWEFAAQQPGSLDKFLPEGLLGDPIVEVLPLPQNSTGTLGLLSSDGRFKRLPVEAFSELSGRAATVLKLKEGVTLTRVVPCCDGTSLVVGSSSGRLLRLDVNETTLPVLGRAAQGPTLLRLLPGETIVGAACVADGGEVLLASQLGLIKRLAVASLRPCQRGDLGQIGLQFLERRDQLIDLQPFLDTTIAAVVSNNRSQRLDPSSLPAGDTAAAALALGLAAGESLRQLVTLTTAL